MQRKSAMFSLEFSNATNVFFPTTPLSFTMNCSLGSKHNRMPMTVDTFSPWLEHLKGEVDRTNHLFPNNLISGCP
jgi:hypothetical protein